MRAFPSNYQSETIAQRIPGYKGVHGGLHADKPIPPNMLLEMRRDVAHACVKTQTAIATLLLTSWEILKRTHKNPQRFEEGQHGPQRWKAAHTQVLETMAKAGSVPDLMRAVAHRDTTSIHALYAHAYKEAFGSTDA